MKKIVWLSHPLNASTPLYGGATGRIEITRTHSFDCGDTSEAFRIGLDNHSGTHIDFPSHFCSGGKRSNDYSADFWHFEKVTLMTGAPNELQERVEKLDPETDLLLLKTGFERFRGEKKYWEEQPPFQPELAAMLRERCPKLRMFGFDMISLSSFQHRALGREAHRAFLCDADLLLIEDMRLSELSGSPSTVTVAPWQIDGLDGTPCNVVAHV